MLARFRALHGGADRRGRASRSAAMRCCASPRKPARARRAERARRRRGLGAARPRRRRPRDRPRLRPAGLHADVHAHDEAEGAASSCASTRASSTRRRCARRATCATSTTSSPRPLHGFRERRRLLRARLGQAAPRPHPHSRAGAEREQRSVPAGVGVAAARRGRRRASRLWQPAHGGHVGFARGPLARPPARPARGASPAGWRDTSDGAGAHNRADGRDRRRGAEEVAQRAALLRLARARRARRLVHARRPHPGSPGPFPRVKGSRIDHEKLREFIARNYASDDERRLVLPERAAARLRRARGGAVGLAPAARTRRDGGRHEPHRPARPTPDEAFVDEAGRLFLASDLGLGLVHTLDMGVAAEAVERGVWRPQDVAFEALVGRFGYRLEPRRRAARKAEAGCASAGYFAALTM